MRFVTYPVQTHPNNARYIFASREQLGLYCKHRQPLPAFVANRLTRVFLLPLNPAFMDIKLPLTANVQMTLNKAGVDGLNLKMGQLLDAKVIETQILMNTLSLKVADKALTVQADRPLSLQSGQSLQLQVVKLLPLPEFKIVPTLTATALSTPLPSAAPSPQPLTLSLPLQQDNAPILKLVSQAVTTPPVANVNINLGTLQAGEQLQARIVNIADNKITLQLLPESTTSLPLQKPANMPPGRPLIILDAKQLILPTPDRPSSPPILNGAPPPTTTIALKADMPVTLQVLKPGQSPTFNVLPAASDSDQKIFEALKQLLPIQASPTLLLNQLQLALPRLQADPSVAETLKNLAQVILDSTPNKTRLTEASQLKQTVNESGLFMESKLAELLSGKTEMTFQDDFKLKLGKLIQLLHREMATQPESKSAEDNEILKQSLQKAQGALAKLTLDQLNSLPRDESPKQGWILELPFFNNNAPDSVKIEIEQDKAHHNDSPHKNWAVSITITPPDLATIHCKISCYDGSVNTRFWSEAAGTVEKINANLDYLKQQFELKGLSSGFMQAQQGLPAQTDSLKTAMISLLNEKA